MLKIRTNKAKKQILDNAALNDRLFILADKSDDAGDYAKALKLFLEAANNGHVYAMSRTGYAYDVGLGTRKNRPKAMFWYKKAARYGDLCAINNIGTIYRDEGNIKLARKWFLKALSLNHREAALELGKLELKNPRRIALGLKYLRSVVRSKNVIETCREKAQELLNSIGPTLR